MKNLFITDEQKREIEELAKEHKDSIVALGSQLYAEGIGKGMIAATMFGAAFGGSIAIAKKIIKSI